jgi:regulatory protein
MMLTPEQAIARTRKYCAYQERSQDEVRNKLYTLGLHRQQVEQAIAMLITENFINEERFAMAFAGGKFRIKNWGRIKIKMALKQKKVSEYCIRKSLAQFSNSDYTKIIRKLIRQQEKKIVEKNLLKKNYSIARYLISRGFEPDLVWAEIQVETDQ